MKNKIDICFVLEILRERDKDQKGFDPDQWLDAKAIESDSFDQVLDGLVENHMDELVGKLMRTQDPSKMKPVIVALMSKAFELGFTASEIQFEEMFTNEDSG